MNRERKRKLVASVALCLLGAALAGAACVGLLRDFGPAWALKLEAPGIAKADLKAASVWLNATASGDEARALAAAARIAPESESFETPRPEYLGTLCDFRIRIGFLCDPFNFADFARWRSLLEAKRLAEECGGSPEKLLAAVMEKAKSPEDRARLLCEAAAQAGYESVVIGVPKAQGVLAKTLCLLREGAGSYVADPELGTLLKTAWPLSSEAEGKLSEAWDEAAKKALKGPLVLFAPCEPQDFRKANALLYARLEESGAKGLPAFPTEPLARLEAVKKAKRPGDFASFWHPPFMALGSSKEAARAGWILDSGK